jgi:lambda repressor-like predicted transcriptional regulator
MDYPQGFPSHLKPSASLAVRKAFLKFPGQSQATNRIRSAAFALCEICCAAAEEGEWKADLALAGMEDFLHILCVNDPWFRLSPISSQFRLFSEPIKAEVINSKAWLGYLKRLAKLGTAKVSMREVSEGEPAITKEAIRRILDDKGWSIGDWAAEAKVSYNTAASYMDGKTTCYKSTRAKLAKALGLPVNSLPER